MPLKPKPPLFFDEDIEPVALCANCEYFNGGGLSPEGRPINDNGDCLNSLSPRFTTTIEGSCTHFFPCSTRWPNADHD